MQNLLQSFFLFLGDKTMLKYPNCEICRRLREVLPEDEVPDEIINDYHESKGSYELFPKKWQDVVIEVMLSVS